MSKKARPRLSKSILEMKFMRRTKVKVDKEIEDAEGRKMYSSEITDRMLNNNSNFIMEPSFAICESLMEGRLSFRGMNTEIERMLELEQAEKDAAKRHTQPKEVTDQEMVEFYRSKQRNATSAGRSMHKKFERNQPNSKKRAQTQDNSSNNKKMKFLKPRNDDSDNETQGK